MFGMKFPIAATGLIALSLTQNSAVHAETPRETHGVDISRVDTTVKPDVDFYRFANGGWLDSVSIPADKPAIDAFTEVSLRNEEILKRVVEKAAQDGAKAAPGSELRKIGEFYKTGMDQARADRLGITPLKPVLSEIDALKSREAVMGEIGRLERIGVEAGFGSGVEGDAKDSSRKMFIIAQGGLTLPDRDYYLKDDPQSKALRALYTAAIGKLLQLAGEKPEAATKDAGDVLAIETRLAQSSRSNVKMRDVASLYHPMTLKSLTALTPTLAWPSYFHEIGLANPGKVNVATPEFFTSLATSLSDAPLSQWKNYLRYKTIITYTPYLSTPFADEAFRFAAMMTGQKEQPPRWRRVLGTTEGALGDAVGKLYVAEAFPPEAKARALTLVLNLKAALRTRIVDLDWMGAQTKVEALRKLDEMHIKVGYPDKWKDYSGLDVRDDSYAANVMRANQFAFAREIAKAGKPVDRSEWGMTPPTVNAYYNPQNNEIVFPAGILQPPFFDPKADDASNYGAIGAVIGHEMTHGFDDQGRTFDSKGNLRDWWTAEDAAHFKERSAALVKQYSAYPVLGDVKVNGELTQGENIADLGGIIVAYEAWKLTWKDGVKPGPIDGYTADQRFFLAFAQIWRFKSSPEYARLLANVDPHSPSRWRVLGTLVNVPAAVAAFGPGEAGSIAQPGSGSVKIW